MKKAYAVINGTRVENLIESELPTESIVTLPGRVLIEVPLNHELGSNYSYIDGTFVQIEDVKPSALANTVLSNLIKSMDPNTKRDLILEMITELQQPTLKVETPEPTPAQEPPTPAT